jgi:hypothetical protein
MTSPYVTSPAVTATPKPGPSVEWRVVRALLSTAALVVATICALIAAFASAITWSGCFIECTGGNHRDGGLLALLAVGLLASGPAAVAALYRSRVWVMIAEATTAVGAVLLMLVLSSN